MSRQEIQDDAAVEMPDPLAPAAVPRLISPPQPEPPQPWREIRPHRTWQQVLGALILTAACVAAAGWYVPRVLTTDGRLLTGSVVNSGVVTLNFTSAGEIERIAVHPGQRVHKGQLLATEYAPNVAPVLSADSTAIRSDQSKLAAMRTTPPGATPATPAELSAEQAQLKLDQAQLATDRVRMDASRILAPAAGAVVAANGRPGEAVTPSGLRDYAVDTPRAPANQAPLFSLLPEGPQAQRRSSANATALPVIALRTSSSWQVAALVPESAVFRLTPGRRVTIGVPAAHLTSIPGRISQVLSNPVSTPQGNEYQALVTVVGHVDAQPLAGMSADVRLAAPTPPRRR